MLMNLSASCMAITMSSMLVFFSDLFPVPQVEVIHLLERKRINAQ